MGRLLFIRRLEQRTVRAHATGEESRRAPRVDPDSEKKPRQHETAAPRCASTGTEGNRAVLDGVSETGSARRRGEFFARATHLAQRLLELRSTERRYWSWGYSFPWQTRRELVPRFAPNLVCTSFAAHALLDAYESGLGSEFLAPAVSAGEYIVNELYWDDGAEAGYAYPLPAP